MTFQFDDQVVFVSGASRGIGRAIALMFAEHGARVAIHYHTNREQAERTRVSMRGDGHLLVQADFAEPRSVRQAVEAVFAEAGHIDVLVNNAGIFEPHPLPESGFDQWQSVWERTIDTNLSGSAHASFTVAQHMIRQGGGRIINITSRGAFRGEPDAPAYGASKAGLNAFSQSLAQALAPYHIYVYAVAPGWVETDMAAPYLSGEEGDSVRHQSPLGRVARPEEIARTVLFLASPGQEFLTGGIIDVNGASYLRT